MNVWEHSQFQSPSAGFLHAYNFGKLEMLSFNLLSLSWLGVFRLVQINFIHRYFLWDETEGRFENWNEKVIYVNFDICLLCCMFFSWSLDGTLSTISLISYIYLTSYTSSKKFAVCFMPKQTSDTSLISQANFQHVHYLLE